MSLSSLIHGTKPQVAEFIPTDPIAMLQQLLGGEIKNWDQITNLSDLYQTYMMGAFEKAIPGFGDILKQGGIDTEAILKQAKPLIEGKIPQDMQDALYRSTAFQSLGSQGVTDSGMRRALTARDFGKTSLDLMQQGTSMAGAGANAAQRWQDIAKGEMLPPSSSMYSPQWYTQFMAQQNAAKQATQQLKYNVAAMPDPAWSARAKLLASYGGMALGGMGGNAGSTQNYDPGYSVMSPTQEQQFGQAFGPQMESSWGGTNDYGQQSLPYNTTPYQSNISANPWG